MRITLAILLLLTAHCPAQVAVWRGTNSQYAIQLIALGPPGAPTNHGLGKVWLQNGQAHPAQVYIGSDGWRTLDYGAGIDPSRIKQFKILATGDLTMIASNNASGSTFTLHRQ